MRYLSVFGLVLLCGATASAQAPSAAPSSSRQAQGAGATGSNATARATMADAKGGTVGDAELLETPHGILLKLNLKNVPAGGHALHVHQVGRCEAPAFQSAGGHYAPDKKKHGFLSAEGPHAGDLPNIDVPASGQLKAEHMLRGATLKALLDSDGAAIVIHAGLDDYRTDPAGDAGARIVCGVIAAK